MKLKTNKHKIMNKVNWKNELSKLREYIEVKHMTFEEVGKIYNKPKGQIEVVCIRYGIKYAHRKVFPWREDEINTVKEELLKGKTYEEISELLPGRTKNAVKSLYEYHSKELNLVKPKKPNGITSENEIKIKELVLDGYPDPWIKQLTGVSTDWILKVKEKYNIIQPSIEELQDKGIFFTSTPNITRIETELTKEKLILLLNDNVSICEMSRRYSININTIRNLVRRLGWKDEKLASAKNLKRKLYKEIHGIINPTEKQLNKSFLSIFTRDYILDLLIRNEYSLKKCSLELDNIDPKCISSAIKKYNIDIPEDFDYKRKFGPSFQSRMENNRKEFREYMNIYFPDYEIIEDYIGSEEHIKLRCKIHPEEIIVTTPYSIKTIFTLHDENGNIIGTKHLCKKCKDLEEIAKKLTVIKKEIEETFPGKFDLSESTIEKVFVSEKSGHKLVLTNIKCNKCGNVFKADIYDIRNSRVCKFCDLKSSGEIKTKTVLDRLGISYTEQKLNNHAVPKEIRSMGIFIDFCLEYNGKEIWIEYNGSQHYKFSTKFHQNMDEFKNNILRDLYERKYCEENGILLIEIPYTFDTIDKIQNLLQKVIIDGQDINTIIDYKPFYEKINKLGGIYANNT